MDQNRADDDDHAYIITNSLLTNSGTSANALTIRDPDYVHGGYGVYATGD